MVDKAKGTNLKPKIFGLKFLKEAEELDLIKKIGSFPDILLTCQQQMDPFPLVSYLQELATCFHKFYDVQRIVDPEKKEVSRERLGLTDAVRITIANGLRLLGISTPKKM